MDNNSHEGNAVLQNCNHVLIGTICTMYIRNIARAPFFNLQNNDIGLDVLIQYHQFFTFIYKCTGMLQMF